MNPNNRTQFYATGTVDHFINGRGVLVARVQGILTQQVGTALMSDLRACAEKEHAIALVVLLELATVAVSAEQIERYAASVMQQDGRLAMPIAVVTKPEDKPTFDLWAWRMAERGHLRGAFTCPALALSWAARKGAVASAGSVDPDRALQTLLAAEAVLRAPQSESPRNTPDCAVLRPVWRRALGQDPAPSATLLP
jgi:hypothetical protein